MKIKLTRVTDGRKIIPEIEGLRFISILLVVFSHIHNNTLRVYPQQLQFPVAHSSLGIFLEECGNGVNIFFFISGFILAIPFFRDYVYNEKKVSLKHYYYRRLTRIEPPYIISLIFFFLVAIFVMHQPTIDTLNILQQVFFIHTMLFTITSVQLIPLHGHWKLKYNIIWSLRWLLLLYFLKIVLQEQFRYCYYLFWAAVCIFRIMISSRNIISQNPYLHIATFLLQVSLLQIGILHKKTFFQAQKIFCLMYLALLQFIALSLCRVFRV